MGSAGTTWEAAAAMPIVAATLPSASRTGMPAAMRAPKASSMSTRVTGRLIPSAEDRSSATWSLMSRSVVRSPACRTVRSGWSAATAAVTASSGAGSSTPSSSDTATSIAVRASFHTGASTSATPSASAIPAATSVAARDSSAPSARPAPSLWSRTTSPGGADRPACSAIASARPDCPMR